MVYPEPQDRFDWTVAEAKAHFSELIERARRERPQTVSKNGKAAVVIVSADEWERKTRRVGTLVEFLQASPLRDLDLEKTRKRDRPKRTEL